MPFMKEPFEVFWTSQIQPYGHGVKRHSVEIPLKQCKKGSKLVRNRIEPLYFITAMYEGRRLTKFITRERYENIITG